MEGSNGRRKEGFGDQYGSETKQRLGGNKKRVISQKMEDRKKLNWEKSRQKESERQTETLGSSLHKQNYASKHERTAHINNHTLENKQI